MDVNIDEFEPDLIKSMNDLKRRLQPLYRQCHNLNKRNFQQRTKIRSLKEDLEIVKAKIPRRTLDILAKVALSAKN